MSAGDPIRVTCENLVTGERFMRELAHDEWVVISGPHWRLLDWSRVPLRGDIVIRLRQADQR